MSTDCHQVTNEYPVFDEVQSHSLQLADALRHNWNEVVVRPLNDLPIPFEHALWPFLMAAAERAPQGAFLDLAWSSLEGDLLRQLHETTFETLYQAFCALLSVRLRGLNRLAITLGCDAIYQEFTLHLLDGGLQELIDDLPTLADELFRITDRWTRNTALLAERLERDRPLIEQEFAGGRRLGAVVEVSPAKSDPHNGGQTVAALRFASGLRLIYKPRSTRVEQTFAELLSWINQRFPGGHFREVKSVDCGDYGWVEFIETRPCIDAAEAALYFERAGMLMALVYLLGSMDCHGENLLATGSHPVLVDLETIMRPDEPDRIRGTAGGDAQRLAVELFNSSVMASGLLPRWDSDGESGSIDVSGLGGVSMQTTLHRHPKWTSINTDAMRLTHEFGELSPAQNVAMLDGRPLGALERSAELNRGFEAFYRFAVSQKELLLSPYGPLEKFAGANLRVLFRSTTVYADILDSGRTAEALREGDGKQRAREALQSASWMEIKDDRLAFQIEAESTALSELDVPYFTLMADSRDLVANESCYPGFFKQTPLERARATIAAASAKDLAFQTSLIRTSLRASAAVDGGDFGCSESEPGEALSPAEFAFEAAKLAHGLVKSAIVCPQGTATWLGVSFLSASGRFNLQPVGAELYGGSAGIVLFLAAVERILGEGHRKFCQGALAPLRRDLLACGDSMVDGIGIGGVSGMGSLVFSLAQTARLLDDEDLIRSAKIAAKLLTPNRASKDEHLDVISGSAGAALALLALHSIDPEQWMLEMASVFGSRLVEAQVETASGHRAWRPPHEKKAFTGLSHGAAGISLTLLRLFQATGDQSFKTAALEGIEYERTLFDAKQRNWADVREPLDAEGAPSCRNSWCHGAPGIALARVGGLEVAGGPAIVDEITHGVATTLKFGLGSQDHFCCGGTGRLETLIEASRALDRPDLLRNAEAQASQMIYRARRLGGYQSQSGAGSISVGLFAGDAGIGYTLLRMAHPGVLPSIGLLA